LDPSVSFGYAKKLDCCPHKWQEAGIAGFKWVECLMKWHLHLSLSFNQKNDTHFQNYYKKFLVNFKFTGNQIYNLAETSVTNVVQAPHIVAQTGVKQTGHAVSAKRDPLITVRIIISTTV
jgi:N-acetyl-gamma-glutamylphosphate reductase